MPISKQKAKRPHNANVTLHDFFGAPKTLQKQQESSQKGKGKQAVKLHTRKALPQEIIVIDSDSDDEPQLIHPVGPKRRRLSESLKVPSCEPSTSSSPSLNKASGSLKDGVFQEQPSRAESAFPACSTDGIEHMEETSSSSHRDNNSTAARNPPVFSFGIPTLLLGDSGRSNIPQPSMTSFGQPSTLLASRTTTSLLDIERENITKRPSRSSDLSSAGGILQEQTAKKQEQEVDIDLTVDDYWEMGDDEVEVIEDASEEMDDNLSSKDVLPFCPSCEKELYDLSPLELQKHINDCLDASSLNDDNAQEKQSEIPQLDVASTSSGPMHGPLELLSCDGKAKPRGNNAFSFLMSSSKESEVWKEADTTEDKSVRPTKANGGRRRAPFYKVLQGMPIAVDAFCYGTIPGVTAYFLTHAHSDHYTNLSSNWKSGPIFCSEATANLIVHMLSVDRKWVHPLPMDVPTIIADTGGVQVTFIEANHCPGSCLFFFEGRQTVNAGDSNFKSQSVGSPRTFRYLHCGDFRASPRHVLHPAVKGKKVDHVYLDTTYLDPKYTFPAQPLVISACAELARRTVLGQLVSEKTMDHWMTPGVATKDKQKEKAERMLVVVGTYSIGKERIVKAIAHALDSKIYCDRRKAEILRCEGDQELDALLTLDPRAAVVHLVPLGTITSDGLKAYIERFKGTFTKAIGFRPTGWTFTPTAGSDQMPTITSILSRSQQRNFSHVDIQPSRNSTSSLKLFPVPYSEHSSFYELTCFALSFDWSKMIATVNVGSDISRGKMAKWVAKWEAERKKRGKDVIVPHRHPDYW